MSVRYNRKLIGSYVQENPLSESESNNLKQLCANGGDYSIRAVLADRVPLRSSESFVKAVGILMFDRLNDRLSSAIIEVQNHLYDLYDY